MEPKPPISRRPWLLIRMTNKTYWMAKTKMTIMTMVLMMCKRTKMMIMMVLMMCNRTKMMMVVTL